MASVLLLASCQSVVQITIAVKTPAMRRRPHCAAIVRSAMTVLLSLGPRSVSLDQFRGEYTGAAGRGHPTQDGEAPSAFRRASRPHEGAGDGGERGGEDRGGGMPWPNGGRGA